jgi:hypothetical protein
MRRPHCRRLLVLLTAGLLLIPGSVPPAAAVDYSATPSMTQSWIPNGLVYDILTVGERVYIGGAFTRVRNPMTGQWTTRNRLAAFDRMTGVLLPWNPGADDRVRALAAGPDGTVYAGGRFSAAAGTSDTNVIAINPDGSAVNGFRVTTSGEVRDLTVTHGGLFVAGSFGNVNGTTRVGVARVHPETGQLVRGFNARLGGGRVFALEVGADGSIVLGGHFKTVAGRSQPYLARVAPGDGIDSGWSPTQVCDTCRLLDVVTHTDGRLYAAIGGPGGGRVAAWSYSTGGLLWSRRGNGDVQAVDVQEGRVYAGGHFGPGFDGGERHQFALLDAATGRLEDMSIPFTGNDHPGIWAVDVDDLFLRLGGAFQGIEGSSAARYATFSSEGL